MSIFVKMICVLALPALRVVGADTNVGRELKSSPKPKLCFPKSDGTPSPDGGNKPGGPGPGHSKGKVDAADMAAAKETSDAYCAGDGKATACCICANDKGDACTKAKTDEQTAYCKDNAGSARCVCAEDRSSEACKAATKADRAKHLEEQVAKCKDADTSVTTGEQGRFNNWCKDHEMKERVKSLCDNAATSKEECDAAKKKAATQMHGQAMKKIKSWDQKSADERKTFVSGHCKKHKEAKTLPDELDADSVESLAVPEGTNARGTFKGKFAKKPSSDEPWVPVLGCILSGCDPEQSEQLAEFTETMTTTIVEATARRLVAAEKTYSVDVSPKTTDQIEAEVVGSAGGVTSAAPAMLAVGACLVAAIGA